MKINRSSQTFRSLTEASQTRVVADRNRGELLATRSSPLFFIFSVFFADTTCVLNKYLHNTSAAAAVGVVFKGTRWKFVSKLTQVDTGQRCSCAVSV